MLDPTTTTNAATKARPPAFDGHTVTLAGQDYVLPPLSFGGLKRQSERIKDISESNFPSASALMDAIAEVIYAALVRNYPELSIETVEDGIDWSSAPTIFSTLMVVSMPPMPAGEPRAESQSGASTGN